VTPILVNNVIINVIILVLHPTVNINILSISAVI
ncbi:MAG: hypothetical protein K0Q51_1539, partial [Rickettsiaceae bacterium]|nr:hypothetical protein [Rickettsiaceae bacterium]